MAGNVISTLYVEFRASVSKFADDMKTITKESREFERTLKPLSEQLTNIGTATAAVGAAVVATMTAMVVQAANYGDAIRDASVRTGMATEELSGYKIAAEESGATFEDLNTGLKKFAVNINAAAHGSKEQAAIFKNLGVNIKDASGQIRPMSDILRDFSDKFKDIPAGAEQAATAVAAFGKGGNQLIEFLSQGSAGFAEFQNRAERFGIVVNAEAAAAADAFNDTLTDLKSAILGLSISVASALLPSITNFIAAVADGTAPLREFISSHKRLTEAVAAVALILSGSGGLLVGLGALLLILPKVTEAWAALDVAMTANPVGVVIVGIGALIAALIYFRNEIAGAVAYGIGTYITALGSLITITGKAASFLGVGGIGQALQELGASAKASGANLKDISSVLLAAPPVIAQSTAAVNQFKQGLGGLPSAFSEVSDAQRKSAEDFKALSNATFGFLEQVKGSPMTLQALNNALVSLRQEGISNSAIIAKLGKDAIEMKNSLVAVGVAVPRVVAEFSALAEKSNASAEATKKLNAAIDAMVDSVNKDRMTAPALAGALLKLQEQHISNTEILEKLGSTIRDVNKALLESGMVVDPVIKQFADLAKAQDEAAAAAANVGNATAAAATATQTIADTTAAITPTREEHRAMGAQLIPLSDMGLSFGGAVTNFGGMPINPGGVGGDGGAFGSLPNLQSNAMSQSSQAPDTGGSGDITFHITALDGADVARVVQEKVWPVLRDMISGNLGGTRTVLKKAVA